MDKKLRNDVVKFIEQGYAEDTVVNVPPEVYQQRQDFFRDFIARYGDDFTEKVEDLLTAMRDRTPEKIPHKKVPAVRREPVTQLPRSKRTKVA